MDNYGQVSDAPVGQYLMMTSGEYFNCGIHKQSVGVDCWGLDQNSVLAQAPLIGNYDWISAGRYNMCVFQSVTFRFFFDNVFLYFFFHAKVYSVGRPYRQIVFNFPH